MPLWPQALTELGERVANGTLKYRETVAQGIESAPEAFIGLLKGRNFGKQLVKLDLNAAARGVGSASRNWVSMASTTCWRCAPVCSSSSRGPTSIRMGPTAVPGICSAAMRRARCWPTCACWIPA